MVNPSIPSSDDITRKDSQHPQVLSTPPRVKAMLDDPHPQLLMADQTEILSSDPQAILAQSKTSELPPLSVQAQRAQNAGWNLILRWLLVSAAGASAVGSVHWLGGSIVNGVLLGTTLGLLQWLVLRRVAKGIWWWVLATTVGGTTGALMATTMLWMLSA